MTEKEQHPFLPYIPGNATRLIIGTTPPPRFSQEKLSSKDVNFYYGSKDNKFWDIIGDIANIDFKKENTEEEIEKRKKFLDENDIGICDIVYKTNRKKPDSALDEDLIDIEHLDIVNEILVKYPKMDTLLYTSGFVKQQITQLLKELYGKEICHNGTDENRKETLIVNNKKYNVYILFSPSPNALRGTTSEKREEQYKKFLNI
jgi:G:T/U-mismatch repair DNA glycosylase